MAMWVWYEGAVSADDLDDVERWPTWHVVLVYDNANGDLSPQEAKLYAGRGEGAHLSVLDAPYPLGEELFANRTDLARLPGVYWLSEKSRTGTFLAAEFPDPTDEAIGCLVASSPTVASRWSSSMSEPATTTDYVWRTPAHAADSENALMPDVRMSLPGGQDVRDRSPYPSC